jgi:hypothetical protein
MMPLAWTLVAGAALQTAILAGAWWHGHTTGRAAMQAQLDAIHAVAAEQQTRYRKLEQEVSDVQAAHLTTWRAARSDADAAWLRLRQERAGRVPHVPTECGSAPADSASQLERSGDLLAALVAALEAGERLQATLTLCQTELRQCAAMR